MSVEGIDRLDQAYRTYGDQVVCIFACIVELLLLCGLLTSGCVQSEYFGLKDHPPHTLQDRLPPLRA